jgi:hypothetical protein
VPHLFLQKLQNFYHAWPHFLCVKGLTLLVRLFSMYKYESSLIILLEKVLFSATNSICTNTLSPKFTRTDFENFYSYVRFVLFPFQDQKRPIYDEIRVDPAFRKVGKSFIGFHVWRIENDFIEYIARDKLGTFCDENAYIIYSASLKGAFSDQSTIVSI